MHQHEKALADGDFIVLENEAGFLVVDQSTGEAHEVNFIEGQSSCECFLSQVASDHQCEHTRTVERFLERKSPDHPMSMADADRYLAAVARIEKRIGEIECSADNQKQAIDQWREQEVAKLARKRQFYLLPLEGWIRSKGSSSERLVAGKLLLRKQPKHIEIIDEQAVLNASRFRRVVPERIEIDKRELRKYVNVTGQAPDGVLVVDQDPKFSYQINEVSHEH